MTLSTSGWLFLDKPSGISSNNALSLIKKQFNIKPARRGRGTKIGFAGTLDPLASGLLPIGIGEATKVMPYMVDTTKTYEFTVLWGQGTDTDDSEGEIVNQSDLIPRLEQIQALLPDFTGCIMQSPPIYSAIKIDGQRAYKLARQQVHFTPEPKPITVESIEVLKHEKNTTDFRVTCGKGTYVRALARDMATVLATFGHIISLRRTAIGAIKPQHMVAMENISWSDLQPVHCVIEQMPLMECITQQQQCDIMQGRKILLLRDSPFPEASETYRLMYRKQLLALGHWESGYFYPKKVFP